MARKNQVDELFAINELFNSFDRTNFATFCPYCHPPFLPVYERHTANGYYELLKAFKDNKGVYFEFHELRPGGYYSAIGLDTFTNCPKCGRKL